MPSKNQSQPVNQTVFQAIIINQKMKKLCGIDSGMCFQNLEIELRKKSWKLLN
jgi:hypothetical protein